MQIYKYRDLFSCTHNWLSQGNSSNLCLLLDGSINFWAGILSTVYMYIWLWEWMDSSHQYSTSHLIPNEIAIMKTLGITKRNANILKGIFAIPTRIRFYTPIYRQSTYTHACISIYKHRYMLKHKHIACTDYCRIGKHRGQAQAVGVGGIPFSFPGWCQVSTATECQPNESW